MTTAWCNCEINISNVYNLWLQTNSRNRRPEAFYLRREYPSNTNAKSQPYEATGRAIIVKTLIISAATCLASILILFSISYGVYRFAKRRSGIFYCNSGSQNSVSWNVPFWIYIGHLRTFNINVTATLQNFSYSISSYGKVILDKRHPSAFKLANKWSKKCPLKALLRFDNILLFPPTYIDRKPSHPIDFCLCQIEACNAQVDSVGIGSNPFCFWNTSSHQTISFS